MYNKLAISIFCLALVSTVFAQSDDNTGRDIAQVIISDSHFGDDMGNLSLYQQYLKGMGISNQGDDTVAPELPNRTTALNRTTSSNQILSFDETTKINPFWDIAFRLRATTSFGWDMQTNVVGFSYELDPMFEFYFGPRKTFQTVIPKESVYGYIKIEDFRIMNYADAFSKGGSNSALYDIALGQGGSFIPIITWGTITTNLNVYGVSISLSSSPSSKLNSDLLVGVPTDVYMNNARYGKTLSADNVSRLSSQDYANDPKKYLNKYYPIHGQTTKLKEDKGAWLKQINSLHTDTAVSFLYDGVKTSFRNRVDNGGPGIAVGYTFLNSFSVNLMFASMMNLKWSLGKDFSNNEKNKSVMKAYFEMLEGNTYLPGFRLIASYNMAMGGQGGLGGNTSVTNLPLGFGLSASYIYFIIPNQLFIKAMVDYTQSVKTSNAINERNGFSVNGALQLGWPVGAYDDGTPYYSYKDVYRNDEVLKQNPVFSNRNNKGGISTSFNYVQENNTVRNPYMNFNLSLYENDLGGFFPGLGVQLSYSIGQIEKDYIGRHALQFYVGYYVTPKIRLYMGNHTVFAGSNYYFSTQNKDQKPLNQGMGANFKHIRIYDERAQTYLKLGVLFEKVVPYTSFVIQYDSNELIHGYKPTKGSPKVQRAGAIVFSVVSQF